MKYFLHTVHVAAWIFVSLPASGADAPNFQGIPVDRIKDRYDVIVAGAGTGGCGAAIQAARLGASVLLLDETDYIGGQMNAAAVTSMDEGVTLVRGRGLYKELVGRIEDYYRPLGIDPETAYNYGHICVEPRVGRRILHQMLETAHGSGTLDLSLRSRVTKVTKTGDTVTGVELDVVSKSGTTHRTVQSTILIDATEWGDVIPLTGARYRVGNCTNDQIVPTQRLQDNTWTAVVRKYPDTVPLALVMTGKPPGYTDAIHQMFVKTLVATGDMGINDRPWSWVRFIGYRGMPNSAEPKGSRPITRTHLNFNNDFPSSVAEIEDPAKRQATDREMRLRTLQLIYYIQNTLGFKDWAVANDEGYDTPYNRSEIDTWLKERPELEPFRAILYNFPVMPYVRESRRIIGLHTLCAPEIDRRPGHQPIQFPTSVAIGDYPVDMHGSMQMRYLEPEFDRQEDIPTKFGEHGKGPFAIPFESFIPEKVDGFLPAEKNLSQSRMGNGATRLQPHTLLMGQAAGAIAGLAVKYRVQPRAIEPVLVQDVLARAQDPLNYTPVKDLASDRPDWSAIQIVTARGMLPLAEGLFRPKETVSAEEAAAIMKQLSNTRPKTALQEPVTRGAFVGALTEAAQGSNVSLDFAGGKPERAAAITRSEAAQVVAEFLTLRARAKVTHKAQKLEWKGVRPASDPSSTDVTSTIARDIQSLVDRKLISSFEYWMQNAVPGGRVEGERIAEMFTLAARSLDPASSSDTAVDVMARVHVIGQPDYWRKTAVSGGICDGKSVATVLRNLAKTGATAVPKP